MQKNHVNSLRLFAAAFALCGATGAHAQTLLNAGFESPFVGTPNNGLSYQYNPSGGSWVFLNNSGISAAPNTDFVDVGLNPTEGSQVAFLQSNVSNGAASGVISQTVSGFTVGQSYQLLFDAAQRTRFGSSGTQDFRVSATGLATTVIGTFQPLNIGVFQPFNGSFTPDASTVTLTFTGLNTAGASDTTAFIDNVRLNAVVTVVPEGSTLALVGVGLLGAVSMLRRRA